MCPISLDIIGETREARIKHLLLWSLWPLRPHMKSTVWVSGAEAGAVAVGALKSFGKEGKDGGQRGSETRRRARAGWDEMKGGWTKLRGEDREQTETPVSREGEQIHLILQLLSVGASSVGAGLVDFKCSFLILEAKRELMVFPILLVDWESFTARQALLGPVNPSGKESRMFPALVLSSHHWKRTRLFLLSLGNQVLMKPGTP